MPMGYRKDGCSGDLNIVSLCHCLAVQGCLLGLSVMRGSGRGIQGV